MGVDWYPCKQCGKIVPDCGDTVTCDGCEEYLCWKCYPQLKRGKHTFICAYCWNDDPTIADQLRMLRYLQETCHMDLIKIRNDMRKQGLVPRKRNLDFSEEKDEEERRKIRCREGPPPPRIERCDQYDGVFNNRMGGCPESEEEDSGSSEEESETL